MDESLDARIATQAIRHGAGNGAVNRFNFLRSSRSMEHRAPTDAQLRLFPAFRDENEQLQTLHEQCPPAYQPMTPPPPEKKPVSQKFISHLSGRDILADLQVMEKKEAQRNHVITLCL